MMKIILALLTLFVLHAAARAADKITIGVPELNAQFVPLALAEKKGFFREVGIQADVIRINPTVPSPHWSAESSIIGRSSAIPSRRQSKELP